MSLPNPSTVAEQVLAEMKRWIHLAPSTYTASVRLFALRLPPERLIEALWIAQARKPKGGRDAFRYFCGVCHTMVRERKAAFQRN